jgi:hypothetical protein
MLEQIWPGHCYGFISLKKITLSLTDTFFQAALRGSLHFCKLPFEYGSSCEGRQTDGFAIVMGAEMC